MCMYELKKIVSKIEAKQTSVPLFFEWLILVHETTNYILNLG